MAKKEFETGAFDPVDKEVPLWGPEGFVAQIDYDDVDHKATRRVAKKMIRILNKHWNEEA